MKIEFTKEQYKALLKLIYCWDMMINWTRLHEDRILEIDNLCSYIYSKSIDFWCENLVDYYEEKNIYIPSRELEENDEINDYIDTYDHDSEVFWEDLIDMLVDRDLKEKNPLIAKKDKNIKDLLDFYWEEFHKNWIKNLKIIKK